ncbi:hypothetical protein VMCG_06710 [Cytospora schulzeri]|uniref:Nudix hydrolase domain-containing protein n=1 Tax=Cytospora schulzeri TaxID=448051 RepID=A0A423W5R2_9PEZI|nr:hypothetical protein VMCG_06710 [Valsa malicola]
MCPAVQWHPSLLVGPRRRPLAAKVDILLQDKGPFADDLGRWTPAPFKLEIKTEDFLALKVVDDREQGAAVEQSYFCPPPIVFTARHLTHSAIVVVLLYLLVLVEPLSQFLGYSVTALQVPRFAWKKDDLDFFGKPVPVYLPDNITLDQLKTFIGFRGWKDTTHKSLTRQSDPKHGFHAHPYSLKSIEVQSVDRFPNGNIGFIKLNASVERATIPEDEQPGSKPKISKNIPGNAFLSGGSVAMLMILRPKDTREERYFLQIPVRMLDNEQNFSGAAAKEIEEETGFKIPHAELVDMTELALKNSVHPEKSLQSAMYSSPGGCDEYIALFLWEKELDR